MLQAESGANDGTALPFVMLPILILQKRHSNGGAVFGEFVYNIFLYQVVLSVLMGVAFGIFARALEWAGNKWSLIDEPSFLAHVIGLALASVGLVRATGSSGVLSVFCATIGFSNHVPTAEENRYDAINGIELIVTISFFTLFGAILPFHAWAGLGYGRLIAFSAAILVLKRPAVVLGLAPLIPQLQMEPGGKRPMYIQAAFAGFYGPIGVGALFYAAIAYESLKDTTTFYIVSFVVLASVLVHGISAAPLSRLLYFALNKTRKEAEERAPADGAPHDGAAAPPPPPWGATVAPAGEQGSQVAGDVEAGGVPMEMATGSPRRQLAVESAT